MTKGRFDMFFIIKGRIINGRQKAVGYCLTSRRRNKELDRSYTVKVGSQINMVDRTLLKLEQYRKWVDRTL